jgi:integrase
MEDVGYAMVTKMLVLTGMRIGELIALEINDVDFERNVIKITKTYELYTGMVGTPKTFDSAREIHMRPEVAELAKSAVHRSKQIGLANGHRSKLLFPWHDGGYLHYTAYRAYFGPRAERVTGRKISIHALRHTFTALMAEADVPLPIVSRQLGHHDSKVTADIYMHVTEERKKKDASLLDNVRIM